MKKEGFDMQHTLTRSLIETLVRGKLSDLQTNPERTTRNLVDMALHFSKGRFQKHFFKISQTMLQDENSPYYQMVYHAVANIKHDRLLQFGMNLGYNSCTYGAQIIRKSEEQYGFNIPWCITLYLNPMVLKHNPEQYHKLLQEGKAFGIYTWHIIANNCLEDFLPIAEMNSDCAFVCFCETSEITESLLTTYSAIHNLMFAVKYNENKIDVFHQLKEQGFLYSTYVYYDDTDVSNILSDDLLCTLNETDSLFAVLIPAQNCSETERAKIIDYVEYRIHNPSYKIIPFEFFYDIQRIDEIISQDSCSACFHPDGSLVSFEAGEIKKTDLNHFTNSLKDILKSAFPK